jgi:hypothetical protein
MSKPDYSLKRFRQDTEEPSTTGKISCAGDTCYLEFNEYKHKMVFVKYQYMWSVIREAEKVLKSLGAEKIVLGRISVDASTMTSGGRL